MLVAGTDKRCRIPPALPSANKRYSHITRLKITYLGQIAALYKSTVSFVDIHQRGRSGPDAENTGKAGREGQK